MKNAPAITLALLLAAAWFFAVSNNGEAAPIAHAALIDRVAAYVDNEAVTLSELEEKYEAAKKISPDIRRIEVVNTMINRLLLKREAARRKIIGPSADAVIEQLIDLTIRSYIIIKHEEIERFFAENIAAAASSDIESIRAEIEKYLTEIEVNRRLAKLIEELRNRAYIKIQL
jgi:hypothetical protein